ncbi:hypothetical protein COOONC_11135 [Cooperia oncophora]
MILDMTPTPRGVFSKYVTPNPATFCFDQTAGYFVDPETKFYYDQKTGYYYNNETRKWCTWDATYSTYFPIEEPPAESSSTASTSAQPASAQPAEAAPPAEEKKEEKQDDAPKSAKDIAKEMMKWAKKQEKQSKVQMSLKPLVKPLETKSAFERGQTGAANIVHKMLEKSKESLKLSNVSDSDEEEDGSGDEKKPIEAAEGELIEEERTETPEAPVPPRRHLPTAQEHREMMERALVDEPKKMCLLCKRAFPSVDVLRKHIEKSDLHKKNLEEKRVEWGRQYVAAMMERDDEEAKALAAAAET